MHLLCDERGNPLEMAVSGGQTHESQVLIGLLEQAERSLTDDCGELAAWPVQLAGDKAYRADWIDEALALREIEPVVPGKKNERPREQFDAQAYRRRNIIERLVGWLKECRRIVTRFEKLASSWIAMITLACIRRYLKLLTKNTFSDRA